MLHEILQLTVFGIIFGSMLALTGIGLSLTYSILRFANFAHGDTMAAGSYLALAVMPLFHALGVPGEPLAPLSFGLPLILALLAGMAFTAGFAVLIDKVLYQHLRHAGPAVLLIASVGVAVGLRNLIQFVWSPQPRYYIREIQIAQEFWGIRIKPDQIFIVAVSALLVLAMHLFLTRTRMGKAMRASADNMELARVAGIDTGKVILWTWIIGGALAGAGGVLAGIEFKFITPDHGWTMLIFVFAAVILGGIGSPYGAALGGLVIGVSGELSTLVISTDYKQVVAFAIMVLMLLVRPRGLFGSK